MYSTIGGSTSPGTDIEHPRPLPVRPPKPITPRPIPLFPILSTTTRPITQIVPLPDLLSNNTNNYEAIGTVDNNFIQDDEGNSIFN